MRRLPISAWIVTCAGLPILLALLGRPPAVRRSPRMAALTQSYIAADAALSIDAAPSISVPRLIRADGSVLPPERLHGLWSVIFFGFTACPLVCPTTLTVLSAVARDPASGVPAGTTQLIFVSIDTARDTPGSIGLYLENFDRRILGLTGSSAAVDRFSRDVGAGYRPVGSGFDHATSLFVLDPQGRLAGTLLRPNDPARIVADLAILRRTYAAPAGDARH